MQYFLYLILALILASCAGGISSIYSTAYPLTTETAKAKTSSLSVKIPEGWFAAEDNEQKLIDLWLIKDDYSAALNFVALNVDSLTMKEIQNDELKSIVELSQTFKKAKYGKALTNFTNQEFFEINKKHFAAYEYLNDSKKNIRVVVFKIGNKFYELSAVPYKTENLSELYKIQNSVLASIRDF
ncbi:MAG: hypothetical protein AB1298_00570 [Bacteroidota bacterium]